MSFQDTYFISVEQMNHQGFDDMASDVLPHALAAADSEGVEIVSKLQRKSETFPRGAGRQSRGGF